MRYFVVADDGQKYGPVDIDGLQLWAAEGRLLPHTVLQSESTGDTMPASAVRGLALGKPHDDYHQVPTQPHQWQQPPTNYYRPNHGYGPLVESEKYIQNAYIFGALGLLCCFPFLFVGLSFALRAKKLGNPRAVGATTFSYIMIGVWVVLFLVRFGFGFHWL